MSQTVGVPPQQQSAPLPLPYEQQPPPQASPSLWPMLRWGLLIWASAGIARWAVVFLFSPSMRLSVCDRAVTSLVEISGLALLIAGAVGGGSDGAVLRRQRGLLHWGSILVIIGAGLELPLAWYINRWQSNSTGWLTHCMHQLQYIVVPGTILAILRRVVVTEDAASPRGPLGFGGTFAERPAMWLWIAQIPCLLGTLYLLTGLGRWELHRQLQAGIRVSFAGSGLSFVLSLCFCTLRSVRYRALMLAALNIGCGLLAFVIAIAAVGALIGARY